MRVEISDDFDLAKIYDCGQCFRAKPMEDGSFRFITGENVLYIKKIKDSGTGGIFEVSCGAEEWDAIWKRYFDLDRAYSEIRSKSMGHSDFLDRAVISGTGIRILRQDPWEMLITFIISQRKNIPAIASCVESLCEKYGRPIETKYEKLYSFPTAGQMREVSLSELKECSLGYRAQYVYDATFGALRNDFDLRAMEELTDEALFDELLKLRGVGKKVANCVCLFGFGRVSRAPVDVWIQRAIDETGGEDLFKDFEEYAGIIQQYVFYYRRYVYGRVAE